MRLPAVFIACLLAFAATEARADAAAEALFRSGREAVERGDWPTACARFEESHRLEPAVGTVFNLANCREKLGQLATAWQRYREVRERLSEGDERVAVTDERIAALEPRLPKLTLERGASAAAARASVVRDGTELGAGSFGLALPVDPGKHTIIVRAPGHAERRYDIELKEAEQQRLVLEAGEAESATASAAPGQPNAPDEPQAATEGSPARTWGFVLGGVGIAGLVTGAVTGALVLSKKSVVESECVDKLCSQEGVEAGEDGKLFSTISTVSFIAGAALVATGATLILTANDGRETARVEVRGAPGVATLNLKGRF